MLKHWAIVKSPFGTGRGPFAVFPGHQGLCPRSSWQRNVTQPSGQDARARTVCQSVKSHPFGELILFQECSFPKFLICLLELGLCVHYDWPIPGDGLLEWFSRDEQKPNSFISGLDRYLIAAIKEDE